ncbi:hypothetical protein L593_08275 [Salinarchaeum sp. Harcht-Bsk1]|uniref:hypothetical protein n=1 Tax=Salinarchaeum sp. Harcht-Bsk1 TaxID=1333523 RepID=UPI0003423EFE|nr:hypothetical protein [Salinarchaeum sp. Harcht-Bsk1]AGN01600.1 hypothetical protein L593_08275 [Salinarchaeum sp. Harcht-Bsk1]
MATDHWGAPVRTPTAVATRDAPLRRLPVDPGRCAIRGPGDQRRLRANRSPSDASQSHATGDRPDAPSQPDGDPG